MSVLQELIVKFNKNKNQELYIRIIKEIQNSEKLWIAFSEASNNYYLGNEKGRAAAYIFSDKDYFDKYYVHVEQRGIKIKSVENTVEYRMIFFGDLYRCGFDCIVIDNGQTYLTLDLFDIIKKPDTENMPKDARFIINQNLMRTFNWFLQENSKQPANQQMWQLLFSEIFKAEYIIPTDTTKLKLSEKSRNEFNITDDSQIAFPMIKSGDGKKFYPFFTDWNELRKYDMESKYASMACGFKDMQKFAGKADGIVINPYGANFILNNDMLENIAKIAKEFNKKTSKVSVGDPKNYPLEMVRKISECLWEKKYVEAAYLKLMLKDGKDSYLVALEGKLPDNPTTLYNEIAEKALPVAENIPIDFINYSSDFAQRAFKGTRAFYKKKD